MAKTKISELEKQYGAGRNEILSFLAEKGVSADPAGGLDEEAVRLVAEKFGKKTGAPASPAKTVHPVKKKKIIIVTNNNAGKQGSSYSSGSGRNGGRQQGPGNGGRRNGTPVRKNTNDGVYHPIKPKTAPSVMTASAPASTPKPAEKPKKVIRRVVTSAAAQNTVPAPNTAPEAKPVQTPVNAPAAEEIKAAAPTAPAAPVREAAPAPAPAAKEKAPESTPVSEVKAPAAPEAEKKPETPAPAKKEEAAAKAPAQEKKESAPAASAAPAPAKKEEKKEEKKEAVKEEKKEAAASAEPAKPAKPTHYDLSGNTIYTKNGAIKVNRDQQKQNQSDRNGSGRGGRNFDRNGRNDRGTQTRGGGFRQGAGSQQSGGRTFGGGNGRGRVVMNDGAQNGTRGGRPAGGRNQQRGFQGGSDSDKFQNANSNNARRRNNQQWDKRNKKDVAFAEDEEREKRNRSGRFIKPVAEQQKEPEEQIKVITIPEKLTIGELADAMHMKSADLIKKLFLSGKMMTQNSEVTYEEAEDIAADYDILCEKEKKVDVIEELLKEEDDKEEDMVPRPPVIVVMGHVDHGKTSILDYIRHTHVTKREAGGITQAIGAYTVQTKSGRTITFLDTPGHEAFTAMRLRGAQATDIAVLVVAADDGVMPQTVEAINHAKAAGVEIIVAINKIDKPDADPDRVRQQLTKYGLIPSDWGGQTEFVNVSAKTGEGIDDLLETILLEADVLELKANPNRLARGIVLEARLDRGKGPVANVLVQKGTLHVGDFVSAGPAFGKVRALINDRGENVKDAGPSIPVMVMGLSDVPSAGEVIVAHPSNDEAKSYAETYKAQHKEELVEENRMSMNVEDLFDQMREGKMKELDLIVKADVQGSVEALVQSLQKLSNDEVMVKIIHSAVGNITESDVNLAEASNAAIIGFNVHPDSTAKSIADHGGVSIHLYKVIYQCIDDVDAALKGMLAPVYEEKVTGHAEVRQLFKSGKVGNIAGCMVLDGVIEKDASVRVTRDGEQLFDGSLASLKRFKDDVKEVKAGYDCGIVFDGWEAMNVGDQIEAYKMVEVPREEVERRKAAEANKAAKA